MLSLVACERSVLRIFQSQKISSRDCNHKAYLKDEKKRSSIQFKNNSDKRDKKCRAQKEQRKR